MKGVFEPHTQTGRIGSTTVTVVPEIYKLFSDRVLTKIQYKQRKKLDYVLVRVRRSHEPISKRQSRDYVLVRVRRKQSISAHADQAF